MSASLNTSILGFWKLDEADAADRLDYFSSAPALLPISTVKKVTGLVGDALGVGGYGGSGASGTYLIASNNFWGLDNYTDITITLWCYPVNWTGDPAVISNWNNSAGVVQWLIWHTTSKIEFRVRNASAADIVVRDTGTPPTGAWTFIAAQRNGTTGDLHIRVNGTKTSNLGASASVISGTDIVEVGNRNTNGAQFNGAVDCLGFWNRLLTDVELDALYNSGAGLEPPFVDSHRRNNQFVLGW